VATFDRHAGTYEAQVQSSIAFGGRELEFFTNRKVDALDELVSRLVGDAGASSVVDIGCGLGLTDALLAPRVGSLFGVDPAVEAVGEAVQRGTGAHYSVGDARRLPYGEASFDVATAICVFHHIDQLERASVAAEMRRVVRPGGLVVIFEHNPLNPATRVAVSRCEFDAGVQLLTQGTTKRLLQAAGLEVVEVRGIIYTTFAAPWAGALDRALGSLPFGAQYYVAARR
jgi:SAM-dependent methyltransferase